MLLIVGMANACSPPEYTQPAFTNITLGVNPSHLRLSMGGGGYEGEVPFEYSYFDVEGRKLINKSNDTFTSNTTIVYNTNSNITVSDFSFNSSFFHVKVTLNDTIILNNNYSISSEPYEKKIQYLVESSTNIIYFFIEFSHTTQYLKVNLETTELLNRANIFMYQPYPFVTENATEIPYNSDFNLFKIRGCTAACEEWFYYQISNNSIDTIASIYTSNYDNIDPRTGFLYVTRGGFHSHLTNSILEIYDLNNMSNDVEKYNYTFAELADFYLKQYPTETITNQRIMILNSSIVIFVSLFGLRRIR